MVNEDIVYGCQFESWLLYFLSSSLVTSWKKQWKMVHVFEALHPTHMRDPDTLPGSWD